jgi:hypothetical protein
MPAGTTFHNVVNMRGYRFEDFTLTVNLAAAVTAADIGKALSWDTSAANTMKLAADGDHIAGRLDVYEDRKIEGIKVGTVEFKFAARLPIKAASGVAVGNTVVGAGNGEVKPAGTAAPDNNYVAAIDGNYAIVLKL